MNILTEACQAHAWGTFRTVPCLEEHLLVGIEQHCRCNFMSVKGRT